MSEAEQTVSVACVGAGEIGRAWSILFASAGLSVQLHDADSEALGRALDRIDASLAQLERQGLVSDPGAIRRRITACGTLESAIHDVNYIQESIFESVEAKRNLFEKLASLAGSETVIGSSTSEIRGSQFMLDLACSPRSMVVHPLNPPHLIPLVEICPTPVTSQASIEFAMDLMRRANRVPILVRKEISGFILNRLQIALASEAMHLVGEGYCSAEDVDLALTAGLGLRWSVVGPLETAHLNSAGGFAAGIRKYGNVVKNIQNDLAYQYEWTEPLTERIDADLRRRTGEVAARQQWRDERLASLIASLRADIPQAPREDNDA